MQDPEYPAYSALPYRTRMFVDAYLQTWRATEAARIAGYKETTVRGKSYKWLRNPKIAAAIDERLKFTVIESDEVLSRLSQQARVNIADFFIIEDRPVLDPVTEQPVIDQSGNLVLEPQFVSIDWRAFKRYGHLIRKLSWTRDGRPVLELHDGQNALVTIGKYLKLWTDVTENTNLNVEVTADELAQARQKAEQFEKGLLGG